MASRKPSNKTTSVGMTAKQLTDILEKAKKQARDEITKERAKEIPLERALEPDPNHIDPGIPQRGGGFLDKFRTSSRSRGEDLSHVVQMQRLTIATLEKTIDGLIELVGQKDQMIELQRESSEAVVEATKVVQELLDALDTAKNIQLSQAQVVIDQQRRDNEQLKQTNEALGGRIQILSGQKQ